MPLILMQICIYSLGGHVLNLLFKKPTFLSPLQHFFTDFNITLIFTFPLVFWPKWWNFRHFLQGLRDRSSGHANHDCTWRNQLSTLFENFVTNDTIWLFFKTKFWGIVEIYHYDDETLRIITLQEHPSGLHGFTRHIKDKIDQSLDLITENDFCLLKDQTLTVMDFLIFDTKT